MQLKYKKHNFIFFGLATKEKKDEWLPLGFRLGIAKMDLVQQFAAREVAAAVRELQWCGAETQHPPPQQGMWVTCIE